MAILPIFRFLLQSPGKPPLSSETPSACRSGYFFQGPRGSGNHRPVRLWIETSNHTDHGPHIHTYPKDPANFRQFSRSLPPKPITPIRRQNLGDFSHAKVTLMSTANAKNGLVIKCRPHEETTPHAPSHRPTPGSYEDLGTLIAQIPDLDQNVESTVLEKLVDVRRISRALSLHLVLGLGLGLVVGTTLPFVFGKAGRPDRPVTELSPWSRNGSSTGIGGNPSQTTVPTQSSAMSAPTATGVSPQTPTTQYGDSDARYDYGGNLVETVADRRDVPASGHHRDTRYDADSAYPPVADMGNGLRPSGTPCPTPTYSDSRILEPSFARFVGTIAAPPARTSYGRAGSSTN